MRKTGDDCLHWEIKIRKGQKCVGCKKIIKDNNWCFNGHWWHTHCKESNTMKRIKQYLLTK